MLHSLREWYLYVYICVRVKGPGVMMVANWSVVQNVGPRHGINGMEQGVDTVLVLAGIGLIFFLVAAIVLCFELTMRIILTIHCFSSGLAVFMSGTCFPCSASEEVHGKVGGRKTQNSCPEQFAYWAWPQSVMPSMQTGRVGLKVPVSTWGRIGHQSAGTYNTSCIVHNLSFLGFISLCLSF